MKLKKREIQIVKKDSIYNCTWDWCIKQGIEDTKENKIVWLKNKGKKGTWLFDLLLDDLMEYKEEVTVKTSEDFVLQDELSQLHTLMPSVYEELQETYEDNKVLFKELRKKLKEQDAKYNEIMEKQNEL